VEQVFVCVNNDTGLVMGVFYSEREAFKCADEVDPDSTVVSIEQVGLYKTVEDATKGIDPTV